MNGVTSDSTRANRSRMVSKYSVGVQTEYSVGNRRRPEHFFLAVGQVQFFFLNKNGTRKQVFLNKRSSREEDITLTRVGPLLELQRAHCERKSLQLLEGFLHGVRLRFDPLPSSFSTTLEHN
jgi:hypothetical protein